MWYTYLQCLIHDGIPQSSRGVLSKCPAHRSTYNKLAIRWLNDALCSVGISALTDSLVIRKRQLLVAAKHDAQEERQVAMFFADEDIIIWADSTKQMNYQPTIGTPINPSSYFFVRNHYSFWHYSPLWYITPFSKARK